MSTDADPETLRLIMDVKVQLTVRIGSCRLSMREVMALSTRTVLQLDQPATEPVSLFVNDKLIGRGEVVVVDEKFGIKITELNGGAA